MGKLARKYCKDNQKMQLHCCELNLFLTCTCISILTIQTSKYVWEVFVNKVG